MHVKELYILSHSSLSLLKVYSFHSYLWKAAYRIFHFCLVYVMKGMPRDELFGRFYAALDKINFFSTSSVGIEDPAQIAKATQLFDEAFPV